MAIARVLGGDEQGGIAEERQRLRRLAYPYARDPEQAVQHRPARIVDPRGVPVASRPASAAALSAGEAGR